MDQIEYLSKITEILSNCKLVSQGFCKYTRTLIEEQGLKVSKLWKQVENTIEKGYARCLSFKFNNNTYLIDSIYQTLQKSKFKKRDNKLFRN